MNGHINRVECEEENSNHVLSNGKSGFTLVEVMIAASIMIILCVGTLSVFSYAVKVNAGNNLRSQALTVLQAQSELYRSLKFVPSAGVTDTRLNAGTYNLGQKPSADNTVFNLSATITNVSPSGSTDANCTLKQITVSAVPANPRTGWLANLQSDLTILRVRAN